DHKWTLYLTMGSALFLTVSLLLGQPQQAPSTPAPANPPATATPAPQSQEEAELQELRARASALDARLREQERELTETRAELAQTQAAVAANNAQLQTLQVNAQVFARSREGRLDDLAAAYEQITRVDAALTRGALDVQRALAEARDRLLRAAGEARRL